MWPDFPASVGFKNRPVRSKSTDFDGGRSIDRFPRYLATEVPSPRHLQYTIQQLLKLWNEESAAKRAWGWYFHMTLIFQSLRWLTVVLQANKQLFIFYTTWKKTVSAKILSKTPKFQEYSILIALRQGHWKRTQWRVFNTLACVNPRSPSVVWVWDISLLIIL